MGDDANETRLPYLGVQMPDGSVRIEGPFAPEYMRRRRDDIQKNEGLPVTSVLAGNLGQGILEAASKLPKIENTDGNKPLDKGTAGAASAEESNRE